MKASSSIVALAVVAGLAGAAAQAHAQCANLTGNPAPSNNPNIIQKVTLNDGPSNVFGDGDDRFKAAKGIFSTLSAFDPIASDDVSISFHVNTAAGTQMFTTTVPAGATGWTLISPTYWSYADNASPFGIHRMAIREIMPLTYLIKKINGRLDTITNAPLTSGQALDFLFEVENGGVGICDENPLTDCNNAGTSCQP